MVELKRIYWRRLALRRVHIATTVCLFAFAILALLPKPDVGASQVPDVRHRNFSRNMLDGVLAALALPGAFALILTIALVVIRSQVVRRRDPVGRFTRQ